MCTPPLIGFDLGAFYCRITCCPSLRPPRISVFAPLEIPACTASLPWRACPPATDDRLFGIDPRQKNLVRIRLEGAEDDGDLEEEA